MGFGSKQWQDWVLDEEESLPLIEHAYKLGINTWDTVSGSDLRLMFEQWRC
jgi:aryl-alcohol dehydrogenase-like predicted oxidoreductase